MFVYFLIVYVGFVFIGVLVFDCVGIVGMLFYFVVYGFIIIGVFVVVMFVCDSVGEVMYLL